MTISVLGAAALAVSPTGGPDVIVTSDCWVSQAGFVDVDADGVDDLAVQVEDRVYSWPSAHGDPSGPAGWVVPGAVPEDGYASMTSGPHGGPAQLHWMQGYLDDSANRSAEYAIDPTTLELTELWSEVDWDFFSYIGDIDGDDVSDLKQSNSYRLSSTGSWREMPPDWFDDQGRRYDADYFNGVGDVDGDGFDDVLVGWRAGEFINKCAYDWGPAELYLGSSEGLQPIPLWQLWAPGEPELAVGQQVVAIPEQDALVVTMMTESVFCYDWTPMALGVIRGASTAAAHVAQVVQTPEFGTDDGFLNYLFGMMEGPGGPTDLAILDVTGQGQGVHWFSWDPTGSTITSAATAEWETESAFYLYSSYISIPVGRRSQALVRAREVPGEPYELLVWGRTIEDVGPTPAGSAADASDCTFWAAEAPDPLPDPPTDGPTGDTGTPGDTDATGQVPKPAGTDGRCGCGASHAGSIAILLAIGPLASRRRAPRRGPGCRRVDAF